MKSRERTERSAGPPREPSAWWSIIPAAAAVAWYVLEAPPVSGDKDSAEFSLTLAFGGAAHPSGYPLFILCGHFFCAVLHGAGLSWPHAANLWSAFGGGAAVFCLHGLGMRLLPPALPGKGLVRFLLAAGPVLLFGLNPVWTYETTLAEVNSWNVAWAAGTAWLFERLCSRGGETGNDAENRLMPAALWGFAAGIGLAHHLTSILVIVPLSLALAFQARRQGRDLARPVAVAAAASAVPLLSYGFIAWRAFHPALWQWPTLGPGWSAALAHMTGFGFGGYLGRFSPSTVQQEMLSRYVYPLLIPSMACLIAGIAGMRGTRRLTHAGLGGAAAASLIFAFAYGVPDPSSYFLIPLGLSLVGALPGAAALLRTDRRTERWRSRAAAIAGLALLSVVVVVAPAWSETDRYRRELFVDLDRRVGEMWRSIPFDHAIVLWPDDMHTLLIERQLFLGEKPGIEVVNPFLLLHEYPHQRFVAAHRFDPVPYGRMPEGLSGASETPARYRFADEMARVMNRESDLPVVIFDPGAGSVHLLRKAPADSTGRR